MGITVRDLTLARVRDLPPIPSQYATDERYLVERSAPGDTITWTWKRTRMGEAATIVNDDGWFEDWVQGYAGEPGLGRLRFIAADLDREPAGLLTWAGRPWNQTVWLVDIRVATPFRGRGVGSALLARLQEHAGTAGARGICVETQTRNVPAIDFYRRRGFELSGFDAHLYTNTGFEEQNVAVYLFRSVPRREDPGR